MSSDNQSAAIETTFRIRFAETDAMGIVHHSNYLVYFEEGRSELSRQSGASYADLEARGYSLAVSEVTVRYVASAQYDQQITVSTRVEDVRSRSITFAYRVIDTNTGQLLVGGKTKHICIDHDNRVCRIPRYWREAMQSFVG